MTTVVLDYGMGNLRSVEKACLALGHQPVVQDNLAGADKLIIPGVGAFGAAMENLTPVAEEIRAFANSGQPVLGICLGQQVLFESSEELGEFSGLGLLPGRVKYLPGGKGLKVPHMGWSPLGISVSPMLCGVRAGDQVYFVHSLYCEAEEGSDVVATATYGITFPAAVARENIWGAQFHPEKSSSVGLRILRNFLEC